MKVIKRVIIIILILAAAGIAAYYLMLPDDVVVTGADIGTVSPKLDLTGNIEGNELITVYADVSGTIADRFVKKGQRVSEGDVLLSYAGESQQYAVDAAQSNVEYDQKIIDSIKKSRATYTKKAENAKTLISQCEVVYATIKTNILALDSAKYAKDYERNSRAQSIQNDIAKMQDEIASKQSELAKNEIDLKKAELLETKSDVEELAKDSKRIQDEIADTNNAISKSQRELICLPLEGMDPATYDNYIKIQNDLETVTRLWSEAKTDRDTAQSYIKAYDELLGNEQKQAQDEMTYDQAMNELKKAKDGCISPSDGVITKCYVDRGAQVEKGSPVFDMQEADNYKVKLLVSKYDFDSVKIGQTASVSIGKKEYSGKVADISQYADVDGSGKSKAVIEISIATEEPLIIGMEADVIIDLDETANALRILNECLYTDDNGSYLFVVEEGNSITRRYVETGVKDSEYTSIISGLNEGEVVVCDLGAADYENQKINPVSDKKE